MTEIDLTHVYGGKLVDGDKCIIKAGGGGVVANWAVGALARSAGFSRRAGAWGSLYAQAATTLGVWLKSSDCQRVPPTK